MFRSRKLEPEHSKTKSPTQLLISCFGIKTSVLTSNSTAPIINQLTLWLDAEQKAQILGDLRFCCFKVS
jgi:hypothetical protein